MKPLLLTRARTRFRLTYYGTCRSTGNLRTRSFITRSDTPERRAHYLTRAGAELIAPRFMAASLT
jgi:hypothetical protein